MLTDALFADVWSSHQSSVKPSLTAGLFIGCSQVFQ